MSLGSQIDAGLRRMPIQEGERLRSVASGREKTLGPGQRHHVLRWRPFRSRALPQRLSVSEAPTAESTL